MAKYTWLFTIKLVIWTNRKHVGVAAFRFNISEIVIVTFSFSNINRYQRNIKMNALYRNRKYFFFCYFEYDVRNFSLFCREPVTINWFKIVLLHLSRTKHAIDAKEHNALLYHIEIGTERSSSDHNHIYEVSIRLFCKFQH